MPESGPGMWPKLLMQYLPQLVDLLPHMRRVVPMADKFLENRGAQEAKLDAMAAGLRDDLGKVAKAHVAMATQLDSFAGHVSGIEREAKTAAGAAQAATREAERARQAAESLEARMTRLEASFALQRALVILALAAMVAIIFLLVAVLVRQH